MFSICLTVALDNLFCLLSNRNSLLIQNNELVQLFGLGLVNRRSKIVKKLPTEVNSLLQLFSLRLVLLTKVEGTLELLFIPVHNFSLQVVQWKHFPIYFLSREWALFEPRSSRFIQST